MEALWYGIIAAMLAAWAALDGFDFGAGMVQRFVAKTEEERALVIAAIGPVWDGNEVWLVAAGGVFVFAFPRAYAVALSGMYLAITLVLWLLILRGVAIELRAQFSNALWRSGWDGVFGFASAAMAVVAGVALANVIRGVPLDGTGQFHLDLFPATHAGAIDAYAGGVGLLAAVVLAAHGGTYLAWKLEGDFSQRCRCFARLVWTIGLVLTVLVTVATVFVRPGMFHALANRPWAWPLPAVAVASGGVCLRALRRGDGLKAFLASSAFIASLILATAATLFPVILPSTIDPRYDLDAAAAASGHAGMEAGLFWWLPAIALAVLYFVNVFRSMRGKIRASEYAH